MAQLLPISSGMENGWSKFFVFAGGMFERFALPSHIVSMEQMVGGARRPTFGKRERLCLKRSIEALFGRHGGQSATAWPIRAVWRVVPAEQAETAILVSVGKRHFRHAVDRNRAKRLVREAYRLNKSLLLYHLAHRESQSVHIAFVWLSDDLQPYAVVEARVRTLLLRMADKLMEAST